MRVSSASVDGVSPEAVHWSDEPHRPVRHVPLPELSKLHLVLPHIRPDQPTGAVWTLDSLDFRAYPPPPKLSPGVMAGHIVSSQSLVIVKTLAQSDNMFPEERIKIPRKSKCREVGVGREIGRAHV